MPPEAWLHHKQPLSEWLDVWTGPQASETQCFQAFFSVLNSRDRKENKMKMREFTM